MKKNCEQFAERITSLIDHELRGQEKVEVEQHLKECSDCQQAYENESQVKLLLKEKLPRYHAPVTLRSRIRRQLARYGERPTLWEMVQSIFIYRPVPASIAVVAMALFMMIPALTLDNVPSGSHAPSIVHAAQLEGEIVCLDCEFETLSGAKNPHSHETVIERAGLKTENGDIYTFMQNADAKFSRVDPAYLSKKVQVKGTLFEQAHYIQVTDYTML